MRGSWKVSMPKAAAADADEWLALIERLHNNGRGPWKFSDPESAGKLRGCRASLHRFIEAERAKDQSTEAMEWEAKKEKERIETLVWIEEKEKALHQRFVASMKSPEAGG